VPAVANPKTRDEKVENLLLNFSMIMLGMFEGAFAAMAEGMATALSKTADALTGALDPSGRQAGPQTTETADMPAEVGAKVKDAFKGLRKEVAEGFSGGGRKFKEFIKDPAFDEGVRIVESHKLSLPPLTAPLTDTELAGYVELIQSGDPEMSKMMSELAEWQKKTPRFER
jgi:hypothetical protein